MAITKNLVEAMGGTIDVESELGQGSCFEVLLDLKIAEDRTVALAAQEETDEQDGNILQDIPQLRRIQRIMVERGDPDRC